jgi:hypothetical protein
MISDINKVKDLSFWMIDCIVKNKDIAIDPELGCDWDWVAAEVWNSYPGIVNEFMLNEAIDLIEEASEECTD